MGLYGYSGGARIDVPAIIGLVPINAFPLAMKLIAYIFGFIGAN